MFERRYSFTSILRHVAVIGDSLSAGEFQVNKGDDYDYFDVIEYSWPQFLARANSITVYNFTRGGMTAKEYNESFANEHGFFDPKYKVQAYIVSLGVNELINLHYEVGSVDDVDVNDYRNNKDTYIGEYAKIIQRYKEINPKAKFFLMSMPKDFRDSLKNIEDKEAAREQLYKLSRLFDNCYVIDLYNKMPKYTEELNAKYFMNGHLNPLGYVYTADIVDHLIDEIIESNPKDFELIGVNELFKAGL